MDLIAAHHIRLCILGVQTHAMHSGIDIRFSLSIYISAIF